MLSTGSSSPVTATASDNVWVSRVDFYVRSRTTGEVTLLDQKHAQPSAGGIAGDPGTVDTAADDGEVEIGHGR